MTLQLSVFVENKSGSLTRVTQLLKDADINIISFALADTKEYGLLRMMVTEPEKAHKLLKEDHISASLTEVTAVAISNKVGTLHDLLLLIEDYDMQYMYVFSNRDDIAGVILKISKKEEAEKLLQGKGYQLLDHNSFYEFCLDC